jgi:hypothetical protein
MQLSVRLNHCFPFNQSVRSAVAAVASVQKRLSWESFLTTRGMRESIEQLRAGQLRYVHMIPSAPYDTHQARMFYSGHANPLDPNSVYAAATVFAADPTVQMIIVTSPAGFRSAVTPVPARQLRKLAAGDLRALVQADIEHLMSLNITSLEIIGGSAGATRALAAASLAVTDYSLAVSRLVMIEPINLLPRSMCSLCRSFIASGSKLEQYVQQTNCVAYQAARRDSARRLFLLSGLISPVNLAISKALCRGSLTRDCEQFLIASPSTMLVFAYGSNSELMDQAAMEACVRRLEVVAPKRMTRISINGGHHALMCDIYLQAAIVLEAYQSSRKFLLRNIPK